MSIMTVMLMMTTITTVMISDTHQRHVLLAIRALSYLSV